jgi:hypothetical protein
MPLYVDKTNYIDVLVKEGFYKECNLMVDILPLKMLRDRVPNPDSLVL